MEYTFVLPGSKTPKGHVALWEQFPGHPKTTEFPEGGEAYVANLQPRLVAKTPQVLLRLGDGRLKEVKETKVNKGNGTFNDAGVYTGADRLTVPPQAYDKDGNVLPPGVVPPVDPSAEKGLGLRPGEEIDLDALGEENNIPVTHDDPDVKG